jgi:hypothetical protein
MLIASVPVSVSATNYISVALYPDYGGISFSPSLVVENSPFSSVAYYVDGQSYTVTAVPDDGYVFSRWDVAGGVQVANIYSATTTTSAVGAGSLYAYFVLSGSGTTTTTTNTTTITTTDDGITNITVAVTYGITLKIYDSNNQLINTIVGNNTEGVVTDSLDMSNGIYYTFRSRDSADNPQSAVFKQYDSTMTTLKSSMVASLYMINTDYEDLVDGDVLLVYAEIGGDSLVRLNYTVTTGGIVQYKAAWLSLWADLSVGSSYVSVFENTNYNFKAVVASGYDFYRWVVVDSGVETYDYDLEIVVNIDSDTTMICQFVEGNSNNIISVGVSVSGSGHTVVTSALGDVVVNSVQDDGSSGAYYGFNSVVTYSISAVPNDGWSLVYIQRLNSDNVVLNTYYTGSIILSNLSDGDVLFVYYSEVVTTTSTATTITTDNPDDGYVYLKVYLPDTTDGLIDCDVYVGVDVDSLTYDNWTCKPYTGVGGAGMYLYEGEYVQNIESCYILRVPAGTTIYIKYISNNWINLNDTSTADDDEYYVFQRWQGNVDDYSAGTNELMSLKMTKDKNIYIKVLKTGGNSVNKDLSDGIQNTITGLGMNNTTGYWIITILGMGLSFYMFRNDDKMRIVMPVMILGAGIVMGWLSGPLVVLLVIVAGVAIAGFLKNKITGQ